jgi:hypothetical protein
LYKFKYFLDDDDYLEFNMFHHFNSPILKKNLAWLRYGACALFLTFFLAVGRPFDGGLEGDGAIWAWVLGIVLFIAALIWVLAFKHIFALIMRRAIKKQTKTGGLVYGKNVSVSFEADFVLETTELGQNKTGYYKIGRVAEGKRAVYLFTGPMQAIIIPLRIFEGSSPDSPSELQGFLDFVRSKVG